MGIKVMKITSRSIPNYSHEKFLSKIMAADECWNWSGYVCKTHGYGFFCMGGKNFRAHRVSYELFNGETNKQFFIDHICRNRKCVNPDHLREVDPRINAVENSLSGAVKNMKKTHCHNGHELTTENTYSDKVGIYGYRRRRCLTCKRENYRRCVAKKKGLI